MLSCLIKEKMACFVRRGQSTVIPDNSPILVISCKFLLCKKIRSLKLTVVGAVGPDAGGAVLPVCLLWYSGSTACAASSGINPCLLLGQMTGEDAAIQKNKLEVVGYDLSLNFLQIAV